MSLKIQFCLSTDSVRTYNLQHAVEIDENVHKCVINYVKKLAEFKTFIPFTGLSFIGNIKVCDKNDACKTENLHEINRTFFIKIYV